MENDVGRVSGKVAIISGGARGEEEEEARLFVSDSAKIIIGGILDSEGIQGESETVDQDGEAKFVRFDELIKDD